MQASTDGTVASQFGVASSPELVRSVELVTVAPSNPVADALVAALSDDFGTALVGLVFYGSHLNRTAGPRSDWDFFVVVDDYRGVHKGRLHARLNGLLPPSVYRRELTLDDESIAVCKLSIVSAADLDRYTSSAAPDSYLFGRLSKRVALVFARDDLAQRRIVDALARSVALCADWVLREAVEGLDANTLAVEAVAFSYRCEERVEGPARAVKLFDMEAEHYVQVYRCAISASAAAGRVRVDAAGLAKRTGPAETRRAERAAVAAFVRRSRRRARLRWLKNIDLRGLGRLHAREDRPPPGNRDRAERPRTPPPAADGAAPLPPSPQPGTSFGYAAR